MRLSVPAWQVGMAIILAASTTACTITMTDGDGSGGSAGGPPPDVYCDGVTSRGECLDADTARHCFTHEAYDTAPELIVTECFADEECRVEDGIAQCRPIGACYAGEARCDDPSTLARCVDGVWAQLDCGGASCVAQPGVGAQCLSQAAGTGILLRGHVEYEYLVPKSDHSGFDALPQQQAATDLLVTVYDGNELIGMGLSSFGEGDLEPGDWEVELSRKPTDESYMYFWPMLFGEDGLPLFAVAKAGTSGSMYQHSEGYWWWGFGPVCDIAGECDVTDTGSQLIAIEDGSGAAHIYRWLAYALFRMESVFARKTPHSFIAQWEPDMEVGCGTCLLPPGYSPSVTYDPGNDLRDHYDASVVLAGTTDTPTEWSVSIMSHEHGHLVHFSYSEYPHETGSHSVSTPQPPGRAFSEGFATFVGQTNMSSSPQDNDPIYFAQQNGIAWWMDLGKTEYNNQSPPLPDPNGPLDQALSELVVASMMWSLWAANDAEAPQGLGDATIAAMGSERLVGGMNRGYATLDLVDYLDALKCEGVADTAAIAAVTASVGFPYDQEHSCP